LKNNFQELILEEGYSILSVCANSHSSKLT